MLASYLGVGGCREEKCVSLLPTVGANKKFTFRFHSTVVLWCEPFRSVFTESSVFAEVRLLIQ